MVGVLVRLMVRMGYHRDAGHYPHISAFDGEMRRRQWCMIYQFDTLISFSIGLPSMTKSIETDTKLPRNLLDSDFSVNTTNLPPERELQDRIPGSYIILKARMIKIFAFAADASHAIKPLPLSEAMDLDKQLQDVFAAIPESMRMRPLGDCLFDPPDVLMIRFNLALLFHKTRCVLHRRYLTSTSKGAASDSTLAESKRICIESAIASLRYHTEIVNACQPGGQLHQVRWYLNLLTTHDFLLACMIASLELRRRFLPTLFSSPSSFSSMATTHTANPSNANVTPPPVRDYSRNGENEEKWADSDTLIESLRQAQPIWEMLGMRFRQARRAADELRRMYEIVCKAREEAMQAKTLMEDVVNGSGNVDGQLDISVPGFTSSPPSIDLAAHPSTMEYNNGVDNGPEITSEWFDPDQGLTSFAGMLNAPMDIDWVSTYPSLKTCALHI
jgi:hypothetical protein